MLPVHIAGVATRVLLLAGLALVRRARFGFTGARAIEADEGTAAAAAASAAATARDQHLAEVGSPEACPNSPP